MKTFERKLDGKLFFKHHYFYVPAGYETNLPPVGKKLNIITNGKKFVACLHIYRHCFRLPSAWFDEAMPKRGALAKVKICTKKLWEISVQDKERRTNEGVVTRIVEKDFLPTSQTGRIAELRIATIFLEKGYDVFFPYVDRGIDLIVNKRLEKKTDFISLQIKTSEYSRKYRRNNWVVRKNTFLSSPHFFIICVFEGEDSVLVIPSRDIENIAEKENKGTWLNKPSNKASLPIVFTPGCKWSKYHSHLSRISDVIIRKCSK